MPRSEYKKRVKAAEKEKEKAEKAVRGGPGGAQQHSMQAACGCMRMPQLHRMHAAALAQHRCMGATAATGSPGPAFTLLRLVRAAAATAWPQPTPNSTPPQTSTRPTIYLNPQAKKAAEAAAKPAAPKKAAVLDDSAEELDPTLYFENRVKAVEAKKAKGLNPYPHKFAVTTNVPDYVAKYSGLAAGEQLKDVTVSLAGACVWVCLCVCRGGRQLPDCVAKYSGLVISGAKLVFTDLHTF